MLRPPPSTNTFSLTSLCRRRCNSRICFSQAISYVHPSPPPRELLYTQTHTLPHLFLHLYNWNKAERFHAFSLIMALWKIPLPSKGHSNAWKRVKCSFQKGASVELYKNSQTAPSSSLGCKSHLGRREFSWAKTYEMVIVSFVSDAHWIETSKAPRQYFSFSFHALTFF